MPQWYRITTEPWKMLLLFWLFKKDKALLINWHLLWISMYTLCQNWRTLLRTRAPRSTLPRASTVSRTPTAPTTCSAAGRCCATASSARTARTGDTSQQTTNATNNILQIILIMKLMMCAIQPPQGKNTLPLFQIRPQVASWKLNLYYPMEQMRGSEALITRMEPCDGLTALRGASPTGPRASPTWPSAERGSWWCTTGRGRRGPGQPTPMMRSILSFVHSNDKLKYFPPINPNTIDRHIWICSLLLFSVYFDWCQYINISVCCPVLKSSPTPWSRFCSRSGWRRSAGRTEARSPPRAPAPCPGGSV